MSSGNWMVTRIRGHSARIEIIGRRRLLAVSGSLARGNENNLHEPDGPQKPKTPLSPVPRSKQQHMQGVPEETHQDATSGSGEVIVLMPPASCRWRSNV
jgi:hypothetical protein